jgi:hypothetical protein
MRFVDEDTLQALRKLAELTTKSLEAYAVAALESGVGWLKQTGQELIDEAKVTGELKKISIPTETVWAA